MNDLKRKALVKLEKTVKNWRFWQIQWLNFAYFMKIFTKYQLFILTYSLSISYLNIEMLNNSAVAFTQEQRVAIVSAFVSVFIVARILRFLVSVGGLFLSNDNPVKKVNRRGIFFKQLLFMVLSLNSEYLKPNMILHNTSVDVIPQKMITEGLSACFCFLSMIICIHQWWKILNRKWLPLNITSREPLNTDLCNDKVYFFDGWQDFVNAVETGITYRRKLSGDLFYFAPNTYLQNGVTVREQNVTVCLKYSLVTQRLNQLTTAMVAVYMDDSA